MKQIWKQIPKYKKFEISTLGKIRSFKAKKVLRTQISKNGYETICLYGENYKIARLHVASLVLKTFIGSRNGKEASHLNNVKTDNRLRNLIWETHEENIKGIKKFVVKIFNIQIIIGFKIRIEKII